MQFFKNIDMDKVLKNKKQIIILSSLAVILVLTITLCLIFNNKNYEPLEGESQLNQSDLISNKNSSVESESSSSSENGSLENEEGPSSDLSSSESSSQQEDKKVEVEGISLSESKVSIYIGQTKMPIVTMSPKGATDKSEKWSSSDEKIASVDQMGNIKGISAGKCTIQVVSVSNPSIKADVAVEVQERPQSSSSSSNNSKKDESSSTPQNVTYIKGVLIANKTYALPASYNPGVNGEAYEAFNKMKSAASSAGLNIYIASGFRSYETQRQIYNSYVASYGQAKADTFSARPGHSEHQTGLCFDLNSIDDSFAYTQEGAWVAENCYKYGFIIRYPKGKESITGYQYEPWHIRYLGVDLATSVYNSGLSLEEYLGITSSYS